MAKGSSAKGGNSKVRLIVFEAEMSDGDLSQVTQAIQNALRPVPPPAPRVLQIARANGEAEPHVEEMPEVESDELEQEFVELAPASRKTSSKSPKSRTYKSPDVLEVDLDSDVSFIDFATPKAPSAIIDKYLTVAAWFKENRDTAAITADHVYTCFRKIGWSTSIDDFNAPFRKLKHRKYVSGDTSGFAINHLGLDKVRKLGQG